MQGELLTLGDYVAVVQRRKWIILFCTVALALLGYAYAGRKHTTYHATVTVATTYVQAPSVSGSASGASTSSISDERFLAGQAAFARSLDVLAKAAKLGATAVPGATPASIGHASTVTASSDADILQFTVTSGNPAVAAELASDYAHAYVSARKSAVSAQYQPVINHLTQTKNALQAQVLDPATTVDVIRTLRPQITLDVRSLAALSNYLEQESRGVQVQPGAGAPSVTKASPVKYAVMGALAGLILGLIAAFVRNALDRRVRSNEQMSASLELAVLASVPTPSRKLRQANRLVMLDGEALSGEAFRMLAARLEVICTPRKRKVIMVTSALPQEGKSTSAANLAVALAQLGHAVSLVDADLVRPTAAAFFGVGDRAGLTDVLSGDADLSDVAVEVDLPAGIPGTLTVIPPGRRIAEPVGLLASDELTATLKSLAGASRYVIVDSPPLLSISHGMVLGTRVDAILAVTRADQLVTDVAGDLKEALDAMPTPKLGIVVTAADTTGGYGSGYGYYAPPTTGKSVRKTAGGIVPTTHHSPIQVPRTQAD